MKTSKVTSKFQATIPKKIRDLLKIKVGDSLIFEIIDGNIILLKKAKPIDNEYLKALENSLSEWESSSDEEAYEHLRKDKMVTSPSLDEFDTLLKKARAQARKAGLKKSDIKKALTQMRKNQKCAT